jgi:hypothetical protein
MKRCFPPDKIFRKPFYTDRELGRIFHRIGAAVERVVGTDYMRNEAKRSTWFPLPPYLDFHDVNVGFASKRMFLAFLAHHNPDLDMQKAERLANERAIKGKDGQLMFIPDIMSNGPPQTYRYYEIKPDSRSGHREGEKKVAFVRSFMQDLDLPYVPGNTWKPDREVVLYRGKVFGISATVSLHYRRHPTIKGLIVYHFCVEVKGLWKVAVLLAIIAIVLIAILFPDLLPGPWPIPKPSEPDKPSLPAPSPVPPWPKPQPQPQPVPAPALGPGGTISGTPVPLDWVTGLVFRDLDDVPHSPDFILLDIRAPGLAPNATLDQVKGSLERLRQLGAAKKVGDGWVRVPGPIPVVIGPPPTVK